MSRWKVCVGTLFPELFPGTLSVSCVGKALARGEWSLEVDDLRDFASDKYRTVDDMIFGGGVGMLIKCEIIDAWCRLPKNRNRKKVFMSPRGTVFKQNMVPSLIQQDLCILCGRYEGVDARVLSHWGFEEISIGDFVLYGGEVAAMALIEACTRKFVVAEAYYDDSFSEELLEYDQYTRPASWVTKSVDGESEVVYEVPEVLISGNHMKIKQWKKQNSEEITKARRPDLWEKYLSKKAK